MCTNIGEGYECAQIIYSYHTVYSEISNFMFCSNCCYVLRGVFIILDTLISSNDSATFNRKKEGRRRKKYVMIFIDFALRY